MYWRIVILWGFLFFSFIPFAKTESFDIPALTGRVVDQADVLSDNVEAVLSAKIAAHEASTGNQIAIVTLPDLGGRPIESWGLLLGRSWGIGEKGKDNGIVFLIAPNDREIRIEVGYGLEGNLPDATANEIIQSNVIPYFKGGEIEVGVTAGLDAILAALSGAYQSPAEPFLNYDSPGHFKGFGFPEEMIPVIFVGFCFFFIAITLVRRRWDPKLNRHVWYIASGTSGSSSSRSSSSGSSSRSFSGGGGSFGGGGASGKW